MFNSITKTSDSIQKSFESQFAEHSFIVSKNVSPYYNTITFPVVASTPIAHFCLKKRKSKIEEN